MAIIRLLTCNSIFEAHQIKHKLEEEGIPCFLTNENFSSLLPHYSGVMGSGVHIMIDDSNLDKALQIVKPDTSDSVEKTIVCPNCNSKEITYSLGHNSFKKVLIILLSLIAWIPIGNIRKTYLCKMCGTKFKT